MATAARYEVVDYRTEETIAASSDRIVAEYLAEDAYGAPTFWDDEHGLFVGSIRTLCCADWDDGHEVVYTLAEIVEVAA